MKQVSFFYFVLMIGIVLISCETSKNPIGNNSDILGCMESSACNYDFDATKDDGSCKELDVCGVCGGNIEYEENCPECQYTLGCDGECSEFPIILDECGICGGSGIPDGICDCHGTVVDLGCGCNLPASLSYCADSDGDGQGADGVVNYCLVDLPDGWVVDCSDPEPDCATNDTDECGVCGGDGSSCGLLNVYYDVNVPIAGFQFYVNSVAVISASGGAAADAGFSISTANNTVLAFTFSGATIPAGSGVLVQVEIDGDANSACLSAVILSDSGGLALDVEVTCNKIEYNSE